jgi:hypothetical protein
MAGRQLAEMEMCGGVVGGPPLQYFLAQNVADIDDASPNHVTGMSELHLIELELLGGGTQHGKALPDNFILWVYF